MTTEQRQARRRSGPGRLRSASVVGVVGLAVLVGTVYAGVPADAAVAMAASAERGKEAGVRVVGPAVSAAELESLTERVARVSAAWGDLADYYDHEIAPLRRVLLQYSRDTTRVERIAVALVREANRVRLEPRLLLAVLLVENPWLDPEIRSPVGAIGLMQVMPVHRGGWRECGSDLEDIDSNICHGARIFAHYFHRTDRDLDRALLRYNGCVHGTNTPNCHQYPNHVFANAGRASVMAWLGQRPIASAP
jgi:soluble lytic murein transglycosylase-like protein